MHVHSGFARRSESDDKRPLHIHGGFGAVMLYPVVPVGSQEIETETVFAGIVFTQKPQAQPCPLFRVDDAFKNRVLDALAVIQAGFGHSSQAPAAHRCCRGHIVAYQYEHIAPLN